MIEILTNSMLPDPELGLFGLELRTGDGESPIWLRRPSGHATFELRVTRVEGPIVLSVVIETLNPDDETWSAAATFARSDIGAECISFPIDGFVRARFSI
ncbi:MAG TPA: hypothetical protein VHU80_02890, partial [Polyangiaceae bacterium]|nr:hypothetical protein [Polyangiaceae bacterium]